jgi:DNA modification methylase
MLKCSDSLEYLKEIENYGIDMIYADPPYALGSEVIVRKDGKVDYAKASDFMGKWEMPTGIYWEQWFTEAYRTLKHGGYCVMFGMDRQLLLFKYYANLAGFVEQQSLYWYFISNFPKATDLSKMIESKLITGKANTTEFKKLNGDLVNKSDTNGLGFAKKAEELDVRPNNYNETSPQKLDNFKPTTELAKKYDGYKYSISPLKQTCETIMVFKKPTKTGSVLHDCLAYENGDKTITVSALNIDGNRVSTNEDLARINKDDNGMFGVGNNNNRAQQMKEKGLEYDGRYPSQTFISSNVAEVLDKQSKNYSIEEDVSCSKILHKCDYEQEDYDLYNYEPKVNGGERNAGLNGFEDGQYSHDGREKPIDNAYQRNDSVAKNTHPTLKPIFLNEKILKLFKTPNDQKICYPFAGSGSEIIGGIKAGFDNWIACEISQEYVDIANARIKYWKEEMTTQTDIFDFID